MRKALRIIAIASAIVSVLSTVILGCIYLEDMLGLIKNIKNKISNRIAERNLIDDED